jgi:HK97 family phage portal protein
MVDMPKTGRKVEKAIRGRTDSKKSLETAADLSGTLGPVSNATLGEIGGTQFTASTAGLVSPWTALFSREIFKPVENYRLNAAMYLTIPYLHAAINLRARFSVGVGYRITAEKGLEDSAEVKYVQDLFKRLRIDRLLYKIAIHRDIYGNAYLYKLRSEDGHVIRLIPVQPERVHIRLSKETSELLGYIFQPPQLVIGQIPHPITLHKSEMIHFKANDITEFPYGISLIQPVLNVLKARSDVNLILPILFRHYSKPWLHYKYKTNERDTPQIIQREINNMIDTLSNADPDSDLITTDKWDTTVISPPSIGANPEEIIKDLDRQILGVLGVPESYFKATGSTDRMISEQDKGFITMMQTVQEEISEVLMNELIIPELQLTFGKNLKVIPQIQWNEITSKSLSEVRKDVVEMYNSGLITLNEARKLMNLPPLTDEEMRELKREHVSVGTPETLNQIISKAPKEEAPKLPEHLIEPETSPTSPSENKSEEKLKSWKELKMMKDKALGKSVKILEDEDVRIVFEEKGEE